MDLVCKLSRLSSANLSSRLWLAVTTPFGLLAVGPLQGVNITLRPGTAGVYISFENHFFCPPTPFFPIIFFPKVTPRLARYFAQSTAHAKIYGANLKRGGGEFFENGL